MWKLLKNTRSIISERTNVSRFHVIASLALLGTSWLANAAVAQDDAAKESASNLGFESSDDHVLAETEFVSVAPSVRIGHR